MFHKLLLRMSVNFMAVLMIVMMVLGALISRFMWVNELNSGVESMKADAQAIAQNYEYLNSWQISSKVFIERINDAAQDSSVWLLDRNGLQLNITGLDENTPNLTDDDMRAYMQTVLQSAEPVVFHAGFDSYFGKNPVITVAMPLSLRGEAVGAVFVHKKLELINTGFLPLFHELWLAAMIASALGLVLTAYTAVRITRPLTELANAAKRLAQGDMSVKVRVYADDEIGEVSRAFNSMVDALQTMEEQRKGFVANVSHELRSPITSIAGYLQGMLDGTIPQEEHQKYMQVVYDETQRLTRLIRDLLDLSRIESGNVPMNPVDFNINELMRRVLIKYEGRLDEKNMEVEAEFADEPCMVHADMDRIEQVVSNLVDNAIKFCGQYGKLTLETRWEGAECVVTVADDGAGIDEKDLPHVFDRFYTVDKAHTAGKGTGLGLSIVKQILLQHGHDITVESVKGEGTRFAFQLDRAKESQKKNGNAS
ncbi:MAG: ATP-binding protein [Candidatus Spyradocola sp.]|nr:ATP-binding protein [Candidatus Spyradocola sp.]